ncbi:hypothetical protein ERO13_A08G180800v2 [Gossypium hirsutum]|nr:hypothetical protein ERO13_A08G180800v2 [Gossypium hirsutum]
MNLGDLHKVWEIKALKRKPGEEEAKKKILKKIAKQVQPIMCKHKWRVKLLSKFCPNNPALFGLNVGAGIHIKLSTIRDALSLIQAVAMAAERRLQDDIWCGSHCSDIAGDEKSCADTLQDHLDLDQGGERLSICGPLAPICKLCSMERPRDIGTKYKFWSCKFCTLENSVELDKCSVCDQWRYSHGAPISTLVPYVGT